MTGRGVDPGGRGAGAGCSGENMEACRYRSVGGVRGLEARDGVERCVKKEKKTRGRDITMSHVTDIFVHIGIDA